MDELREQLLQAYDIDNLPLIEYLEAVLAQVA